LFESQEKARANSKSFQTMKNTPGKFFISKEFKLDSRLDRINKMNNLRNIYGNLFSNGKVGEFDSQFESDSGVVVNIGEDLKQDDSLWHLIDPEKMGPMGMRLHNGAVFRFGKQRVEIKMVSGKPMSNSVSPEIDLVGLAQNNYYSNNVYNQEPSNLMNFDPNSQIRLSNANANANAENEDNKCWICLEEETRDKPFAKNICKCSNGMSRHVDCLVEWLSKKCERSKMGFITFYDFSKMVCDICKDQFPSVIQYKDKKKMFIDFDPSKMTNPFMVLNIYKIDDNTLKGVAVVEFKKGESEDQARRANKNPNIVTFGRNEKNDLNFKGKA
jgi:hypothetical protein